MRFQKRVARIFLTYSADHGQHNGRVNLLFSTMSRYLTSAILQGTIKEERARGPCSALFPIPLFKELRNIQNDCEISRRLRKSKIPLSRPKPGWEVAQQAGGYAVVEYCSFPTTPAGLEAVDQLEMHSGFAASG